MIGALFGKQLGEQYNLPGATLRRTAALPQPVEQLRLFGHLLWMPTRCFPREVSCQTCSTGRRPWGGSRSLQRDIIFFSAGWSHNKRAGAGSWRESIRVFCSEGCPSDPAPDNLWKMDGWTPTLDCTTPFFFFFALHRWLFNAIQLFRKL